MTDGRFVDSEPVFTADGKYLAFLSTRIFDPVYDAHFFDLSFPFGSRPYLVPLAADTPSPFAPLPEGRPVGNGPDKDEDKDKDGAGGGAGAGQETEGEIVAQDPRPRPSRTATTTRRRPPGSTWTGCPPGWSACRCPSPATRRCTR